MEETVARFGAARGAVAKVAVWLCAALAAPIALIALSGATPSARAETIEAARERCRATVGRPLVKSCMQRGGVLGECRARATPQVQNCVAKALARPNVPVAEPKEAKVTYDPDSTPAVFVAPPRTISDITAILDAEKPDPDKIARLQASAGAPVPAGASSDELARFYLDRGDARADLGRLDEAIADADAAVKAAQSSSDFRLLGRAYQFAGQQYITAGDPRHALELFKRMVNFMSQRRGGNGFQIAGNVQITGLLLRLGDMEGAEAGLRENEELIRKVRTSGRPPVRRAYESLGQSWESEIEMHRAIIFEARGQYREAEAAFRSSEKRRRAAVAIIRNMKNAPSESLMLFGADRRLLGVARSIASQGRLAEAEAEARRALLSRLQAQGKYHPSTPLFIIGLAQILVDQGRYEEAEQLARVCLEISRTVGVAPDSQLTAQLLLNLGNFLSLQDKTDEAASVYAELDKAIAGWSPERSRRLELGGWRAHALYVAGRVEEGIELAKARLELTRAQFGENHYETAVARGTLGIGFLKAHRYAEAVDMLAPTVSMLVNDAETGDDDDNPSGVSARQHRLQNFVEAYITARVASRGQNSEVAAETFRLGDVVRSQSVQQALAASSARLLAKEPALTDSIRNEQDLSKQINALLGTFNNALSLPPSQRNDSAVETLKRSIAAVRAERDKVRADIIKRFPGYKDLVDPKPPSVADIQAALRADEALVSFYFGRHTSFVWAVGKTGPPAIARLGVTANRIKGTIDSLRTALEPQAATIGDIPPFDLALAHDLYRLLLEPVASTWKQARSLVVVTNGALGLLPISLLPTAPAEVDVQKEPLFASYRKVPWLARTHAVTVVPSVAALRTLRKLPRGSDSRLPMIGFGDPLFNAEQLAEAEQTPTAAVQVASARGSGLRLRRRVTVDTRDVDSADLSLLPRLPDTAEELRSMAKALRTEPAKVLHLGKAANEAAVKDGDLSRYRIIAFSTHGLVPGDLDGLTQPALALTAPTVAGVEGDGLLTMEEILPLKLDADWVVLSACNTGAGAGAGAEAASGLGRAFFYAGSRALLVTNWSVHSASARDLVTGIFLAQAASPGLSRAGALQKAMLDVMDGPGWVENGQTLYTYAHPLFWAPYSIIGDGG